MVAPDFRTLRVFICSTFRDMQAEREQLVKRVFPRLRQRCAERGVTWCDVDLRWGILDEEKAEGNVLPICLAEIERCRPYFICLLGERYGWVPTHLPQELLARQPWIAERRDHSVTHLEILHGVLNRPENAQYAHFYLRDPRFIDRLPPGQQAAYREIPGDEELAAFGETGAERRCAERKRKLAALKQRIRESGCQLRENYPDPQALGEWVYQDFCALIDRLYPPGSDDSTAREEAQQAAFAASRKLVYVPDPEAFARLDAFALGDDTPLLAVTGESGAGKSALLANWAEQFSSAHPELTLVTHHVNASTLSADWTAMLLRLMRILYTPHALQRLGDFAPLLPTGKWLTIYQASRFQLSALRESFARFLHNGLDKRTVIVLDGIDQLEDKQQALELDWWPAELPPNLRWIVACRPGRTLERLQERGCASFSIRPLRPEERKRLIQVHLAGYGKKLNPARLERIGAAGPAANPQYLCAILEELRVFGDYAGLDERIGHYLATEDLVALFDRILERYEADFEQEKPGLVGKAMSYLWAAHRGLSETEMLDLLGSREQPLPQVYWSALRLSAAWALTSHAGLMAIATEKMRQAVQQRYLPHAGDRRLVHLALADYFRYQPGRMSRRVAEEYPWHLQQAEAWPELFQLLGDIRFIEGAWGRTHLLRDAAVAFPMELPLWPQDQSTSPELQAYWQALESHSDFRLEQAYRPVLQDPAQFKTCLLDLDGLFDAAGHHTESLRLRNFLAEYCAGIGDRASLARALLMQAESIDQLGQTEAALQRIEEASRIFAEQGDTVAVQECGLRQRRIEQARRLVQQVDASASLSAARAEALYQQALQSIGRQEWARAKGLLEQAEQVLRALEEPKRLVACLTQHAALLALQMGEPKEALALANQAQDLAIAHGLTDEAGAIRMLLKQIRAGMSFAFNRRM